MSTGDGLTVCPGCGKSYYMQNGHLCIQPRNTANYSVDGRWPDEIELSNLKEERDALQARVAALEAALHEMAIACNIVWGETHLLEDEVKLVDEAWEKFHKLLPEPPEGGAA